MNAAAATAPAHDAPAPGTGGPSLAGPAPVVVDPAFVGLISHAFARRHLLLGEEGGVLLVSPRTTEQAIHNAGVRLGGSRARRVIPADDLAAMIDGAYSRRAGEDGFEPASGDGTGHGAGQSGDTPRPIAEDTDLLSTRGKGPVVRLVDEVLLGAVRAGASDVHVQPVDDGVLVRYRVDGVLHTTRRLAREALAPLVSRVKVMARLDVAENRSPQDGRAAVSIPDGRGAARRIDLRIATLPTTYGERLVLRLLDAGASPLARSLEGLGMPDDGAGSLRAMASRTSGIILVCGPTGSGKTTTLYTLLSMIASGGVPGAAPGALNIVTIEDPVEYDLSADGLAISQTQLNARKGVDFATGLRHILRQDPDVIMVGEVRDEETARVAVQASLTGHLVLSTVHTGDAAGAVARLLDLGVDAFLVSGSLVAALAQRLVRRVHGGCAGRGCEGCLGSGFRGRTGVFELLVVDEGVARLIDSRAPASAIRSHAMARGMTTLAERAADLIARGVTTRAEVIRVLEGMS